MDARRIEVSLSQDKINFINNTFQKELDYWKEAALQRASDLNDENSTSNRNQIAYAQNFPRVEEVPSFDGIQEELKFISKYIKDGEKMSLRNEALFGGWIAVERMVYKRDKLIEGKNLPQRFHYWVDKEF